MGKASIGLRAVVLASAAAMALAACGGGSSGNSSNNSSGSGDKPTKGGTLTFLTLRGPVPGPGPAAQLHG